MPIDFPAFVADRLKMAFDAIFGARSGSEMPYPPPVGVIGRARVAIITVIPEEFSAAQDVFELRTNIPETPYFVHNAPDRRDWDLVLTQATDRTNVPFSGDVSTLIQDLRPQVLILLGVAGGLCGPDNLGRDGIDLGHVLIAEYVGYVEFLKITGEGTFHRHYAIDHPSLPLKRNVSLPLQKDFDLQGTLTLPQPTLPLTLDRVITPRIHIGSIVSGEKVMGDVHDPVQKKLLAPFDNSLAVDMESIGMARQVCERRTSFWYHPRYVVIRGISDLVGPPENSEIRKAWKIFAAHAAAVVAKEFIRRLPRDPAPE
jgi:nucleoside phosphorylase